MASCVFTQVLTVNIIIRQPHPENGDSQDQETLIAPTADNHICICDTECSNYHPSLSTLKVQEVELQQDEIVSYIYTQIILINTIGRPHHLRSRDIQGQETFLVSSADNQTCN